MELKKHRLLPFIILSFLFGFIAGIAGEIVTRVYFLGDLAVPYFNNQISLDDLNYNRSNLVIQGAKSIVVNQDVKVEETISSVSESLVGIYKKIETENSDNTSSVSTSSVYYQLDEPLMVGLAVTADGWIAASLPAAIKDNFDITDYVAITSDRKVYTIEKTADFVGLPGDVIFFRLTNANNLSIKKIVKRQDISLGQSLLVINDFNSALLSSLSSFKRSATLLSSDSLNARLELADNLNSNFANSFVFNLAGNLVAIIGTNQEVVPAFSYNYHWQSFVNDGVLSQPLLGVNYLDLSSIKVLGINLEKGAWLQASENLPAVLKNSPAASAGLEAGDIITWVNNQEISASTDLADLISSFKAGDTVNLIYLRNGEEKNVSIKLGAKLQ